MFSLLLETCLLSVVLVMIHGTSRICEQHCQDPSNRDYPYAIPGCNCSHPSNKSISASVPLNKLSPDRTDISVKELIGKEKTKLDLPKIYYVVNPKEIDITITKTQQGHISHSNVQSINNEHNDSNPKTRMELLVQQDRPLYLDIGLQEKSDTKSGKHKELELSEDSLSDCLDLNILIYSRKNNSSITTKKVYNRDMLKKYENLSDPDLILAIKSKCSKPQKVVSKSLTEVRGSQIRNDYKNKSYKQTGFHPNAPSAQGDGLALLPTDTNRQDYELEIEEETDAAAGAQVNKSEFGISKPFIDILDESNKKEQSTENRNSEGPDANLEYDSSAQYPYSGVETSTEDEHDIINDDNKSENTRFHDESKSIIEVTDKDINTSPTEYVYFDHDQNSQNSDLENNYKLANEFAQNIEEFVTPAEYVAKTHFDLENKGTNKVTVTENKDIINENDCPRDSLSTSNINKEPSPDINENYSNAVDTSTKAPFANSSKLPDIPDTKEDERRLDITIPLLETDKKKQSTLPSEFKSNKYLNDIHDATTGYRNYVTTHSPNSIIDVYEFVSNSSVSSNTTNPINGSGTFHEYKHFGNPKMHIQDQTENVNEETSNINKNTISNASLGYSGFDDDDETDRTNFAKDLSNNFTISKGRLEDKSEELHNNTHSKRIPHSNLSEDNLIHNGRPIETTPDSKNINAIVVTESHTLTLGLKSGSQKEKDVSSETKPRGQYSEYEIKIPKIISTELENGTVDSHVDGYEVPPKHDFVPDEDIGAIAEVHCKKPMKEPESDISGYLYFVFGKVAIPAKFIQNSRGKVRLGLDGFSLCRYWLIDHPQSDFLAKLCKSQKQSV